MSNFLKIIEKYRDNAFTERGKGTKFEILMQGYLKTDPKYAYQFSDVWLWNEFPHRKSFGGGQDIGIDIVAKTHQGEFWAIQCKFFEEGTQISKASVDSFLSTSSRSFDVDGEQITFSERMWISTTNRWSSHATESLKNQTPPVFRLNITELIDAPVDWKKIDEGLFGQKSRAEKKVLRPHQLDALNATNIHFKDYDRGRLIMACGTGKTFTSLKIAEKETEGKGTVLFLVPSIALLGQTLREWTAEADEPINAVCICSDPEITRQKKNEDVDSTSVIDLALPASTNVNNILSQFQHIEKHKNTGMTVVFSTYQSIDVISKAQETLINNGFGEFDLIICDEAHRTTGVTLTNEDESAFVKVHNNEFIKAKKRLYMTATPRLYSEESRSKAIAQDAVLCSMDDETLYGKEIYRIGFGEAVERDLLSDYKVLILTIGENEIPASLMNLLLNDEYEIQADDASKLVGCINAMSKQVLGDMGLLRNTDPDPMKRAVAFCQSIKVSKQITDIFNVATDEYISSLDDKAKENVVSIESKHIDGTMTATQRDELMHWLKEDADESRILTNVRCLSEGVDVPSLDAVMFLSARNSQVDVVQSVGRVMRKAPNKKYGYIIIPVMIPPNVTADEALNNNERFKVVWTVLNALRAHDDRFNATVNKIELNKKKPDNIVVGTVGTADIDDPTGSNSENQKQISQQLMIQFEELQGIIYAKMVEKVGDRRYWEQWAKDIAILAEQQIAIIQDTIDENPDKREAFEQFIIGLQKNINPTITEPQAVEMLAQHIITKPVFDALFDDFSFVQSNPVSVSMQGMLDNLKGISVTEESDTLQAFYRSVRHRAEGIDNAEGKQKIIIELYDKFFKNAFPRMVAMLGIVYTPIEVVDFIIHSVNDILKQEFGRSIADENVHILDPFTGTGTFITRLLQSGLIDEDNLERKYKHELHANEIVLLAYYIAAINIENAYHDATPDPYDGLGTDNYTPFEGIVLTDTFQLGETDESEKLFSEIFPQNSERVARQKKAPLRVIMGNPPYSVGQASANDNAQNQKYKKLDARIEETYASKSKASSVKALYDSYIKAFRWSTDRLDNKNGGVIAFVTNSGWLDGNGMDGFRKTLQSEFDSIYVFNLRGNQRTSGELSRQEGGKIFGSGSRTPISITLLVKNPDSENKKAKIHYHDIGDYLNRNEKLKIIKDFHSFSNMVLTSLSPNEHGDWINQRNEGFNKFIPINSEKKFDLKSESFFVSYSLGIASSRDTWVYNYSSDKLSKNIIKTIDFYNEQRKEYRQKLIKNEKLKFDTFCSNDTSKISWNDSLRKLCSNDIEISFGEDHIIRSSFRPFSYSKLYFDKRFIQRPYQMPKLFPTPKHKNLVLCVSGNSKDGTVIITDLIPDLHLNGDTQAFPLYYYEEAEQKEVNLFEASGASQGGYVRKDGVSDYILDKAQKQYKDSSISKEDIFYYVYGFLHSTEYRTTFTNDLKRILPRLPLVESKEDFLAFSQAGRDLAELHVNYETVPALVGVIVEYGTIPQKEVEKGLTGEDMGTINYRVNKMRFPKKDGVVNGKKKKVDDKSTIIYNSQISIKEIPEKAYEYVVNGKSAIEWIMERYQVKTDKKSGIKNDPNDWADEHNNPKYILNLLQSVINLSCQSVDIINGLPKLKF